MRRILLIAAFFSILFLVSATISSAVSCHCFQDRVYDPSRPTAADAYFLASTQNSLLAAALNVSKRNVVQAKMGGADADLLWVAYYLSDRTGLNVSDMIELWTSQGVDGLLARKDKLSVDFDRPFLKSLSPTANLETLARGAYHSVMTIQLGVESSILERLEMEGAGRKEQILTIFISFILGENPAEIYIMIRDGKQTWGEALASTGLDPKQIEASWSRLLQLHKSGLS